MSLLSSDAHSMLLLQKLLPALLFYSDIFKKVLLFLLLIRAEPVKVPLKFNSLDTSYNTDRRSFSGEYEIVQGVPR